MQHIDPLDLIVDLTPRERADVRQFLDFMSEREKHGVSPFVQAADEFIAEHPELLRRLAK
jgi:hypothetical protein